VRAHHSCARTRTLLEGRTLDERLHPETETNALSLEGGPVWCWGYAADGELGDGGTTDRSTPVRVRLPGGARRLVAGSYHTCAAGPSRVPTPALDGGELRCWGSNMAGQLGDGTMINRAEPVLARGVGRVSELALGFAHTCVRSDGAVSCFGANFLGQLGDGTRDGRLLPTAGRELHGRVARLALGFAHSCALFEDGHARCVGDVRPPFDRELSDVAALMVGGSSTCVVLTSGAVRCDGWEPYRQLLAP
jgi:hypothetical protein